MRDVTFRNYKIEDYDAVKQILEEGKLFVSTWDAESRLKKRIEEKEDSIIIASIDNEVVGCVYIIDDLLPFIFRLAVKQNYRKHGIGKRLVSEAEKRLKEHGHKEIVIFVDEKNEELKGWYHKQGFKDANTWLCMWKEV